MTLETLLRICKAYSDMGDAVQSQLCEMVEDCNMEGHNPNAVEMITDWLEVVNRETSDEELTGGSNELIEELAIRYGS